MLRRQVFGLLAAPMILSLARPAFAQEEPRAFVEGLSREVLGTIQSDPSVQSRAAKLADVLRRGLDIDGMAKFTLGRHARTLSPDQVKAFDLAFERNVVETYSDLLARQTVADVTIGQAEKKGERDYLVESTVAKPGAPAAVYGWRVRDTDAGMKVVDVVVGGVSMLVTKRQEFASVIQREGIDGLIRRLQQQRG
jgi:phospholipid transport system substrate-binding protein